MKRAEKREKMIEIFEPYMEGLLARELIDKCLDLDEPDTYLVRTIKKDMLWYGLDLSVKQIVEFIEDFNEKTRLESFDTGEREECADFFGRKITGMDWPRIGDSDKYKREFYAVLEEKSPELGYVWIRERDR